MAELGLAIIPIGLKVCSGLVGYLSGLKDRDDALARLTRQAESLEGCFKLLDVFCKRGHLDPTRYQAVSHIVICLRSCEEGLKELQEFERTQKPPGRLEHGLQRFCFPLRKAYLEQLESMLDRLCQPLNLAIQNLQLEIELANSSALTQNTTKVQQTTDAVSNLNISVGNLVTPVNSIQSVLPRLQDSVDKLVPQIMPQINLVIESRLQAQMEEIRQSLRETELEAIRRHNATNELLSQLATSNGCRGSAVAKMVYRPSAVAELGSYASTCSCLKLKSYASRSLHLGPFCLEDNIVTDMPHDQECPLFVADGKSSRRRTLSCTAIMKFLNSAIRLSFYTNTGAGGFAIGSSLTYFGVVDQETAPAFQVVWLLWDCANHKSPRAYRELCLKAVLFKLREIFSSGRASPTEVNIYGESLLHIVAHAMYLCWTFEFKLSPEIEALFDFLLNIGTPVGLTNADGLLALHIAAPNAAVSASVLGKLCLKDTEMHVTGPLSWLVGHDFSLEKIAEVDRENKKVTEALYGPLTQAIIRSDEGKVKELIDKCPGCLEETNSYGATALYFAVEKPEILKSIVSRARPSQLVQSNLLKHGTMTPLGRAMKISGLICNSQDGDDGSRCPCVAAAKILLDADCPIIPDRDFILGFWNESLFASASEHCKALIAQSLRSRRHDLRDMARQRLLKSECRLVDASAGELDFYAIEVDRKLHGKHLTNFGRMSTVIHDDISHISRGEPIYGSVYLSLASPEDASIFFDLGFLDIDQPPIPTGTGIEYFDLVKGFMTYLTPQYAIWLLKNLPRFWEWANQYSKLKGAGFILADIAGRYTCRYRLSKQDYLINGLVSTIEILDNTATDNCGCLCAPVGCKPFDVLARWLTIGWNDASLRGLVYPFLEHHGHILHQDQLTCLIRQATFEALGMTHTCLDRCDFNPHSLRWKAGKKVQENVEVGSEDHEKVRYLNDLVAEFEAFILPKTPAGLTIPSGQADDDASSHRRALIFWSEIWPHRVEETKKRLEATWDPDVEILNDLGVSLWYEEEEDICASEASKKKHDRHFDDFMARLDKI